MARAERSKTYVIGGDGRVFNREAISVIIRMAVANGAARLIVGQNGILSTGGQAEDFGIKFNAANGSSAPEKVTDMIYASTQKITQYYITDHAAMDFGQLGRTAIGDTLIDIIDPVDDYEIMMRQLFNFDAIGQLFARGFRICFDAMHAFTGPYATRILEDTFGAETGSVINAVPSPDLGCRHPGPNPVWAHELVAIMDAPGHPILGRRPMEVVIAI